MTVKWMLFIPVLVFTLLSFTGGLENLFQRWVEREEYSHGFFIPILSGLLLWHRRELIIRNIGNSSFLGLLAVLISLILLFLGELSEVFILVQFGFVICLSGLTLIFGGTPLLRICIVPLVFLLFAIPLPGFIDSGLSWRLQLLSSRFGVELLRLVGVSVYLQGNLIDLGHYKLQVVEACSGLRYLYPLLSLGAMAAYLYQAQFWKRILVFISVVPIVVLMNSFRIAVIGILVNNWGNEMADGFLHFFEGWVVFMGCAALLLLEIWLLDRRSLARPLSELLVVPKFSSVPASGTGGSHYGLLVVVSILLAASSALVLNYEGRQEHVPSRKAFYDFPMNINQWSGGDVHLDESVEESLAADDYLLANYSSLDLNTVNLFAAYYNSQLDGRSVHSPRICIPAGGWVITDFKTVPYVHPDGSTFPVNRAEIVLNTERQLVYYWFEQRGRRLANEYWTKWYELFDSLTINRTDGALIRVTTLIESDEDIALADARINAFISEAIPIFPSYVPDRLNKI